MKEQPAPGAGLTAVNGYIRRLLWRIERAAARTFSA